MCACVHVACVCESMCACVCVCVHVPCMCGMCMCASMEGTQSRPGCRHAWFCCVIAVRNICPLLTECPPAPGQAGVHRMHTDARLSRPAAALRPRPRYGSTHSVLHPLSLWSPLTMVHGYQQHACVLNPPPFGTPFKLQCTGEGLLGTACAPSVHLGLHVTHIG